MDIDIKMPLLEIIGTYFMYENENQTTIDLPNVSIIGGLFFGHNTKMHTFNAPKLSIIDRYYFEKNDVIRKQIEDYMDKLYNVRRIK